MKKFSGVKFKSWFTMNRKIEERRQKRLANPNTYTINEQDGLYIIQIYNGCDMLLENKCYKKLGSALNQAKKWNAVER